jgi:hypothetical protein
VVPDTQAQVRVDRQMHRLLMRNLTRKPDRAPCAPVTDKVRCEAGAISDFALNVGHRFASDQSTAQKLAPAIAGRRESDSLHQINVSLENIRTCLGL